jgi:deazaflavin-dependent oxidoreductase (nitroreductase family)
VASASGIEKNPQWFHNIVANPRVTVEWQGDTFAAEAVVTEGADRDHLFSKVNEVYRNQQAQSSRTFPVIELRRLQ